MVRGAMMGCSVEQSCCGVGLQEHDDMNAHSSETLHPKNDTPRQAKA
jgi:hypothetical protein